ncbi:hypothetical protein PLANPX_5284 [Lacipirellula parvula]|uniref:Uncharacterized protein n=1 Tax=Lacipirellula parvula TaxID=2650471 RepID=A0A5K7XHZ5_9BACT|nr:hypothetical protein PLANPX_5284 [Lacipirellula parvula]
MELPSAVDEPRHVAFRDLQHDVAEIIQGLCSHRPPPECLDIEGMVRVANG